MAPKVHHTALEITPTSVAFPITLGTKSNRRCRFCGRFKNQHGATFEKVAHVIPVALCGGDFVLSLEECDDCNAKGSKHEGDLCAYFAVARLAVMAPGRGSVTRIAPDVTLRARENQVEFALEPVAVTPGRRGLVMRTKLASYRLSGVVRAVLRLGLFLAPRHLLETTLAPALAWLRSPKAPCPPLTIELPQRMPAPGTAKLETTFLESSVDNMVAGIEFRLGPQAVVLVVHDQPLPGGEEWNEEEMSKDTVFTASYEFPPYITPPSDADVARRAYALWEDAGRPADRGLDHWLRAELELTVACHGTPRSVGVTGESAT